MLQLGRHTCVLFQNCGTPFEDPHFLGLGKGGVLQGTLLGPLTCSKEKLWKIKNGEVLFEGVKI